MAGLGCATHDAPRALPVTGQYTHYALNKDGTPNYVTDSAASGTAWATGTYVTTRDNQEYSWDGTAWINGRAL